jgi:hypothetical protein
VLRIDKQFAFFVMNIPVLILLVILSLAPGCSRGKNTTAATPAPTQKGQTNQTVITPASGATGRVAMVNKTSRFVVLSYAFGSEPSIGQKLNVYRNSLKVAELKVTGPQSQGNTVADITTGEIQIDDEVRED